jgi:Flp pilus assembly pilin Flp
MKGKFGNTLGEYAILLGLVAVLAIASLKSMGASVFGLLGSTSIASAQNEIDDYYRSVIGATVQSDAGKMNPMPTSAGKQRYNARTNLFTDSLSVGANVTSIEGTKVEVLQKNSEIFAEIMQLLMEDPNPDPVLLKMVSELAESGHRMGDYMETAFYDYLEKPQALNYFSREFNQSYTNFYLSRDTFASKKATLDQYLKENAQVLPPELKEKIDASASEIRSITDSLIGAKGVNQANWEKLYEKDSNIICENGGNQMSCVQ